MSLLDRLRRAFRPAPVDPLAHFENALRAAILHIDRHAIVSPQASATYRAFEAYAQRMRSLGVRVVQGEGK